MSNIKNQIRDLGALGKRTRALKDQVIINEKEIITYKKLLTGMMMEQMRVEQKIEPLKTFLLKRVTAKPIQELLAESFAILIADGSEEVEVVIDWDDYEKGANALNQDAREWLQAFFAVWGVKVSWGHKKTGVVVLQQRAGFSIFLKPIPEKERMGEAVF